MKAKEFDISNFTFRKINSGCYRVCYSEPDLDGIYEADITDMTLIDATWKAEDFDSDKWAHLYLVVTSKGNYTKV